MIRELIEAGGQGTLIPIALAGGAMYVVNWFLGFEHRRSERRRQFLELWPKRLEADELWAQVALRHLTGEYLPQAVVNVVMMQPDKAVALIELANVWDYLEMSDAQPPQLRWKRRSYEEQSGRRWMRFVFNLCYFVVAWLAAWLLLAVARSPMSPLAWTWGILGLVGALTAFLLLAHDHRLKEASQVAPRWIGRINSLLDHRPAARLEVVQRSIPGVLP